MPMHSYLAQIGNHYVWLDFAALPLVQNRISSSASFNLVQATLPTFGSEKIMLKLAGGYSICSTILPDLEPSVACTRQFAGPDW